MSLTLEVVRYGPESIDALRRQLAVAQADDPLAGVTVVVARSTVGLALRRHLAAQPQGLVNVRFVTLAQLADEVGGPPLVAAGRQPLPPPVLHAAVRASLSTCSGPLHATRFHPATERAAVAVVRDLQGADPTTLQALRELGPRPAAIIDLVVDVKRRLVGWYDPAEAAAAAVEVVSSDSVPGASDGGSPLLIHLPTRVNGPGRRLIQALGRRRRVVVLLGATGDLTGDQPGRELARLLQPDTDTGPWPTDPPGATQVRSAPSADSEVLLALRGVMERNRQGVALERMAVVHGGIDPYPRLLHESFSLAGIPTNGPGVRPLAATLVGRTLLGALALPDHEWRRDEVVGWLSGGPIRQTEDAPTTVPATRWDEMTRRAGVTAGYEQWLTHLDRRADELAARLDQLDLDEADGDPGDEPDRRRLRHQQDLAEMADLRRFLVELADRLAPADPPATWRAWARWAEGLVRRYLHPDEAWPDDEAQAVIEVADVLARLSVLDEVDPAPDSGRFRRGLESELDAPAPRTSRFGHGVLVGPIESLVGLDLDAVFVVGMTEGTFPLRVRDDPLLPDAERAAVDADLPRRGEQSAQGRRTYLAALACAPERVISYARGDQRRGRDQRPSPWLLESLGLLAGRKLFSRDLEGLGLVAGFDWVPSLTAAVRSPLEPASVADRDLRSLLHWFDAHHRLDGHPLVQADPVLALGLLARQQRRSLAFTRFDGLIASMGSSSVVEGRAVSPTSLEHYAACPRRYLFGNVLWVTVAQRPEDVQRISPMDWGNVVHRVLELFIAEQVDRPRSERIRPAQSWSPADRARLDQLTDEVFADFEQRGLTGRHLLWSLDQVAIRRDLHAFLDADDRYRLEAGVVPERAELAFRPDDGTPVDVHLPSGRHLQFKGTADRVDLGDDGSLVVLDYKTGSDYDYRGIEGKDDPTVGGTKLQLPIYGLAAQSRVGGDPVQAAYWFVSQRGNFDRVSYPLDEPGRARFEEVVEVIVDGIETGRFPGRPGEEDTRFGHSFANCRYCDFDPICPTDRDRGWDRVRTAPELAAYVALSEGDVALPEGEVRAAGTQVGP